MLRWLPRWHHVSRLRSRKPFTPTRLESNSPKSRSTQESKFTSWIPVLYNAPFPAPLRWAIYSLVGITSSHIFVTYFYEFEPTYGISMLPTLASFGDWVFISKYYRRGRQVKAGDIVSFTHPVRIGERAIKRVLAMEGDFVLKNTPGKSEAMIQVPEGHCWVVGDNMLHSRDSRIFGPLPLALISGKVIAKVCWPKTLPQISTLSWIEHGFQPAYIDEDID